MLYLQNYNIILNKGNMLLLFIDWVPAARHLKRKRKQKIEWHNFISPYKWNNLQNMSFALWNTLFIENTWFVLKKCGKGFHRIFSVCEISFYKGISFPTQKICDYRPKTRTAYLPSLSVLILSLIHIWRCRRS